MNLNRVSDVKDTKTRHSEDCCSETFIEQKMVVPRKRNVEQNSKDEMGRATEYERKI